MQGIVLLATTINNKTTRRLKEVEWPLCSCFEDAGLHPLVAAALHNLRCSPLCGLPEELLLEIMKLLDPLSIQCIRRASRLFLRIYSSHEFSHSHSTALVGAPFVPWRHPLRTFWEPIARLQPLLHRDVAEYCADCRGKRKSKEWSGLLDRLTKEYLYCAACQTKHPVGLFSAAQRQELEHYDQQRVCIGQEGHVRICEHKVLKWSEIIQTARFLKQLRTTSISHPEIRIPLSCCSDASHIPAHHDPDSPHTLGQSLQPTITVVRSRSRAPGVVIPIELVIEWVGHVDLASALGKHKQITPDILRVELEQFRKGTAEFLAPKLPPGRLVEMNCFDPHRCRCLQYPGEEMLPHGWRLTPQERIGDQTCRTHPHRRLRCFDVSAMDRGEEHAVQDLTTEANGHQSDVALLRRFAEGQSRIKVKIDPCSSGNSCLRVTYTRTITVVASHRSPGPVSRAWFQALDPESFGLSGGHGKLWYSLVLS